MINPVWDKNMNTDSKSQTDSDNKWKDIPVYSVREDSENKFTVAGSGYFGLLLKSNLSTGFSWALKYNENPDAVQFVERADIEPGDEKDRRFGTGGFELFVFKSLRPGTSELKFIYARPWEKDKKPEKLIRIQILVELNAARLIL